MNSMGLCCAPERAPSVNTGVFGSCARDHCRKATPSGLKTKSVGSLPLRDTIQNLRVTKRGKADALLMFRLCREAKELV
jgi:hypothetical protein